MRRISQGVLAMYKKNDLSYGAEEKLYTKAQLKVAVTKTVKMLTDILKESLTKEIVLTMITQLHDHQEDGKVKFEVIQSVAEKIMRKDK